MEGTGTTVEPNSAAKSSPLSIVISTAFATHSFGNNVKRKSCPEDTRMSLRHLRVSSV